MKKYKWILIIGAVVVAGVAVWYWKFRTPAELIILDTELVQSGTVSNSITATGTLQPVDTVAVGSQVSGTIKKVLVDFNSTVTKGQLLAQLDKSLMDAQVEQYSASLMQARGNLIFQKSNYDRQHKLYAVGAISQFELETAVYQYTAAKENVNSIAAQVKTAKKNLGFTDIYSPIGGTVLSRSVSEGQTVAASLNTPTLFSIAKDLTKMQVQASVDEADIGNVKVGQRVIFSVDAFPTDTFPGTVKDIRLRSSVSANVVTYITIIDAPNPNMKLKPGMTASITIYTKEVEHTLFIPAAAIAFRPDSILIKQFHLTGIRPVSGKERNEQRSVADSNGVRIMGATVWVKEDSMTITPHRIITGLNDKTVIQIVSGLKEGEAVITGYKKVLKKDAAAAKSPFMPTRGGGGRHN
jgi:HlyD family secretion protein